MEDREEPLSTSHLAETQDQGNTITSATNLQNTRHSSSPEPIKDEKDDTSITDQSIAITEASATRPPVLLEIDLPENLKHNDLPDYHTMVVMLAIRGLNEKGGSTELSILDYSMTTFWDDEDDDDDYDHDEAFDPFHLMRSLMKLAETRRISVTENSRYVLVPEDPHDPFYKVLESVNGDDDKLRRLLQYLKLFKLTSDD